MKILSNEQWLLQLNQTRHSAQKSYYAMFSSWVGGITLNPELMLVPVDDHIVHRGDGVFEAFKIVHGKAYLWNEHFERLLNSASAIGLKLPMMQHEMFEAVRATFLAAKEQYQINDAIVRLYVSRGPGTFSPNPYDSIGSQLYIIVTELKSPKADYYSVGASAGLSKVEPKTSSWARLKTCNYLPNVLMKKESVDRGLDFTIGIDGHGILTEGSTENFIIVDSLGRILKPKDNGILKGTMMTRALELAKKEVVGIEILETDIDLNILENSREVMMVGTTLDVLPVTRFEGKNIGSGQPGPISQALYAALKKDQLSGDRLSAL